MIVTRKRGRGVYVFFKCFPKVVARTGMLKFNPEFNLLRARKILLTFCIGWCPIKEKKDMEDLLA